MSTPIESITPSSEIKKEKKLKKIKKEYVEEEITPESTIPSSEVVEEKVRSCIKS